VCIPLVEEYAVCRPAYYKKPAVETSLCRHQIVEVVIPRRKIIEVVISCRRNLKTDSGSKARWFSTCPMKAVRHTMGIDCSDLTKYIGLEVEIAPSSADELDWLWKRVKRLWEEGTPGEWNEASAREFVSPVIGSVAAELNPRFKTTYSKETRAAGKKKRGKVDLTIVSGKAILLAVEVKALRLNQGIAQNLLQLEAIRDHVRSSRRAAKDRR
jgi:hypothetical protein